MNKSILRWRKSTGIEIQTRSVPHGQHFVSAGTFQHSKALAGGHYMMRAQLVYKHTSNTYALPSPKVLLHHRKQSVKSAKRSIRVTLTAQSWLGGEFCFWKAIPWPLQVRTPTEIGECLQRKMDSGHSTPSGWEFFSQFHERPTPCQPSSIVIEKADNLLPVRSVTRKKNRRVTVNLLNLL